MKLKLLSLLLFASASLALPAQNAVESNANGNSCIMYYYVRIQQQVTPDGFTVVDSISKVELEPYAKWLKILFSALHEGMIRVYADAEGSQEIYYEDLKTILNRSDTVMTINPKTLEEEVVIYSSLITYDDITLIKFCEQWSWNAQGQLTKKTLAYAPVIDRDGAMPVKTLFWIKQQE